MNKLVEHILKTTVGLRVRKNPYGPMWHNVIPLLDAKDFGMERYGDIYTLYIKFSCTQQMDDTDYEYVYHAVDHQAYNILGTIKNPAGKMEHPIASRRIECSFNNDGLVVDNSVDISEYEDLKKALDVHMPKIMAKLMWLNGFTNNKLGLDGIKYIPKEPEPVSEPEPKAESNLKRETTWSKVVDRFVTLYDKIR